MVKIGDLFGLILGNGKRFRGMVLVAARTTTELHNNPGWQLPFVSVFQLGLWIQDKCARLFCPGWYGTGTNVIFQIKKLARQRTQPSISARRPQIQQFLQNCNHKNNYNHKLFIH